MLWTYLRENYNIIILNILQQLIQSIINVLQRSKRF